MIGFSRLCLERVQGSALAFLLCTGTAHAAPEPAAPDAAAPDAAAIVARMTVAEKIAQLQSDAPAIPRLGLPAHEWWSEGLHGMARNGIATVFPQAIGLAATWDTDLLHAIGDVVSSEARARFEATGLHADHPRYAGLTLWSPNVNIFRDPRWGRGQETYGEDPLLTGLLAVAFVQGLQGPDPAHPRVIATPKHFAAHSGPETGRYGFDADISPHDLADTYLPAFRRAVVDGHAGSVMCAYNAVNGVPNCANHAWLDGLLRHDWGFAGYVVSDCDAVLDLMRFHRLRPDVATAAAAALKAGVDLDCGVAYAGLAEALRRGLVDRTMLDTALTRLVAARLRLGEIGPAGAGDGSWTGAQDPSHQALALRAARESLVLLRNRQATLPLAPGARIAVIGPDADTIEALEANYHGTAAHPVTPLAAIRARFGAGRVSYAQGAPVADGVPVPVPETALRTGTDPAASPGLEARYLDGDGRLAATRIDRTVDMDWDRAAPVPGLEPGRYDVAWSGVLLAPAAGDYTLAVHVDRCFDCTGHDGVRLVLDGRTLLDDPGSDSDPRRTLSLAAGPHTLRLALHHHSADGGIRLQWLAPAAAQRAQALRAEAGADTVVAVLGLSPDVEGEALKVSVPGFDGGDRTALGLPGPQAGLLDALLSHRGDRRLVVVLMSGGGVSLGSADAQVPALLQAWYPGQAGGTAIADVLSGDADPSGRLPVTIYRDAADLPAFIDYGMQGRTYRYFQGDPLYRFGAGGSYTHVAYDRLEVSPSGARAGQALTARVRVRNAGERAGDAVAQFYLVPPGTLPEAAIAPRWSLVGFSRVHLAPGGQAEIAVAIDPRRLGTVDARGRRIVEPGGYTLFAGDGQPGTAGDVSTIVRIAGRAVLAR